MSDYWISILIPVFNVADYLQDCIDSVVEQLEDGVEVIFLDDASTDNSSNILLELDNRNLSGLRIMSHQHNLGIPSVRNSLLDLAQGEYICFLDSDDFFIADAIKTIKCIINSYKKPDCIQFNVYCIREQLKKGNRDISKDTKLLAKFKNVSEGINTKKENLLQDMFLSYDIAVFTRIIKKSIWKNGHRFPTNKYAEDAYVVPIIADIDRFFYSPKVLIGYRTTRSDSLTNSPFSWRKLLDFAECPQDVLTEFQRRSKTTVSMKTKMCYFDFCMTNFFASMRIRKNVIDKNVYDQIGVVTLRSIFLKNIGITLPRLVINLLIYGKISKIRKLIRYYYFPK